MSNTQIKIGSNLVGLGDYVGFKCDVEQGGKVIGIDSSRRRFLLENVNGFAGGYIGGDTETYVDFRDCWTD